MIRGGSDFTGATTDYFTGLACGYDAHRPSYPQAAIRAILTGLVEPMVIVDVGCGTGISTRLLARAAGRGSHIVGIDPNEDMLTTARNSQQHSDSAKIEYQTGTAEATGLDDAVADVVVCAQAFHWFDARAALHEFHGMLKPHGRLALMWNVKDGREPFSAGFCNVAERAMADAASRGLVVPPERGADAAIGGYFTNIRQAVFDNPQRLDLDGVLGRARSASYFPKHGPLRDELEAELRRLFGAHQQNGVITLWHRTELTLTDRSDA